jgi:hypothetical protein
VKPKLQKSPNKVSTDLSTIDRVVGNEHRDKGRKIKYGGGLTGGMGGLSGRSGGIDGRWGRMWWGWFFGLLAHVEERKKEEVEEEEDRRRKYE